MTKENREKLATALRGMKLYQMKPMETVVIGAGICFRVESIDEEEVVEGFYDTDRYALVFENFVVHSQSLIENISNSMINHIKRAES
jgi:hypothetical protein